MPNPSPNPNPSRLDDEGQRIAMLPTFAVQPGDRVIDPDAMRSYCGYLETEISRLCSRIQALEDLALKQPS